MQGRWMSAFAVWLLVCCAALEMPAYAADAGDKSDDERDIPALNWTKRSDWISVKDHGAVGDGKADDTAAIQAACEKVGRGSVLYLPAGTYRITETLRITGPAIGVAVIGHGRDTKLVWDGKEGGVLFADDGIAHSRYIGITFEGGGKAAIGFHHDSHKRFETEVRHHHLAFRGFTIAGVLAEPKDRYALAEAEFNNCLFENCARGVQLLSVNDYNNTFVGCEFRRCRIGIECRHGSFYARDCHFTGSQNFDILSSPEHSSSVRRCTSKGSRSFLRHVQSVSTMTVEDCHIDGWTSPDGAVVFAGAPALMFDCVFTNGPEGNRPLRTGNRVRVMLSGNSAPDVPKLLPNDHRATVYEIPAGERQGNIKSASRTFLRSTARIPGKVFDAKVDFGAKGDGVADDTAAIQQAIDAAREHGNRAIAYLPTGRYVVKDTLDVTGRNYFVGGTGFLSSLVWRGEAGGTMLHVHDAVDVTLEHLAVGNHDAGQMDNGIDVLHTGGDASTRVVYDGLFVYGMYPKEASHQGHRVPRA